MPLLLAAPVLPFLLWACTDHMLLVPKPEPVGESVQYRELSPIRKVDILFVVDDSSSMRGEQENLIRNFPLFMDELARITGADLHIAVVSSDVGAGAGTGSVNCVDRPRGDNGVFCLARADGANARDTCQAAGLDVSKGRFITTVPPNFQGNIRQRFAQMAELGESGCGFEHSLGVIPRALAAPENKGFLRDDAYLAIIVITDEDDCSAAEGSNMFMSPIEGEGWSMRCATQGHLCNGSHVMAAPGMFPLESCGPAADGGLTPVPDIVKAVIDFKKDVNKIIVAGIFGWPLPGMQGTYRVVSGQNVDLASICTAPGNQGGANPGLRVKSFVESFPERNRSFFSICQQELREAMQKIGERIRVTVGPPCVDARLADAKPQTPAVLDVECAVSDMKPKGNGAFDKTLIPQCKGNDSNACWNLVPADNECPVSGFKIEIDRKGTAPPDGTVQSVHCLTCLKREGCPTRTGS